MKRPALLVFGVLLAALISIYFVIPQYITVNVTVTVKTNQIDVARPLADQKQWHKWWPGKVLAGDTSYNYNGIISTITDTASTYINFNINTGDDMLKGKLSYLAKGKETTNVILEAAKQSSLNPIIRIAEYIRIKNKEKQLKEILMALRAFIENGKKA
jgi:biopolymer transport protein ExbD